MTPALAPNRINVGMAIPAMPNHADIGHGAFEQQLSPAWSRHHDRAMQGQFLEPEVDNGNWTLVESEKGRDDRFSHHITQCPHDKLWFEDPMQLP